MQISIVTDEISADPETAIELGVSWGVRNFELRGIGEQRVPFISNYSQARLHELLEAYGARVVAISPGLCKCPLAEKERQRFPLPVIDAGLYQRWRDSASLVQFHLQELLPAALEYACQMHVERLISFSFHRGGKPAGPAPDEALALLQAAAQQAAKENVQLCVEVEDEFWADTGARTAAMIQAVGQPNLGVNWDPGNACAAGDRPYPDGYQPVRPWVRHVHFKDVAQTAAGEYAYVVDGEIDWQGQIRALQADGYSGYISVEPHMQPRVASARAALQRLKNLLAASAEQAEPSQPEKCEEIGI